MAGTPVGFEVTDFLNALSEAGQKDEKYDSYVRRYTRIRKREIKKENAEEYAPYRVRLMDSIAGFFMILGMLAYFVMALYMTAYPVFRARSPKLSVIVKHMDSSHSTIIAAIVVAVLCTAVFFKGVRDIEKWTVFLSIVWCAFVIVTRFITYGAFKSKDSASWLVLGNLILFYSFLILLTCRFGIWLHNKFIHPPKPVLDIKHYFEPVEVVFLVLMIVLTGICLPYLVNLENFSRMVTNYQAVRIYLMVCPVLIFVLYCIWHANRMDGESVNAWFCASMAVFMVCLILQAISLNNLMYAFFLWMVLGAMGIIVVIYLGRIIGNGMSYLSIAMIILEILLGAGASYYGDEAGILSIGVSMHWWLVVPAFVTIAVAIGMTVQEIIQVNY